MDDEDKQDLEMLQNADIQAVFRVMTFVLERLLLPTVDTQLQTDLTADIQYDLEVDFESELVFKILEVDFEEDDDEDADFVPLDDEDDEE